MRRACLEAFSSVLAWPTTFGPARIPGFFRTVFKVVGTSVHHVLAVTEDLYRLQVAL